MAEFCKECYIKKLATCQAEIDSIVMSEEADLCEGCGQVKPFVSYIRPYTDERTGVQHYCVSWNT